MKVGGADDYDLHIQFNNFNLWLCGWRTTLGCGWNVNSAVSPPISFAFCSKIRITALCPACTPSKVPIVNTMGFSILIPSVRWCTFKVVKLCLKLCSSMREIYFSCCIFALDYTSQSQNYVNTTRSRFTSYRTSRRRSLSRRSWIA